MPPGRDVKREAAVRVALLAGLALCAAFGAGGRANAENASNPLAAVNNVDLRWQFTGSSSVDTHDVFVDGAYMVLPTLKLKYELHYNFVDGGAVRGNGFDRLVIKPIWFPYQTQLNESWGIRLAVGTDVIIDIEGVEPRVVDGGGQDQDGYTPPDAAPSGVNQLGPLAGAAFAHLESGLTVIPLVQHFLDIGPGRDVSQTAFRVIALRPFAENWWGKLDAKLPFDWENDAIPATAEVQIGYNLGPRWAAYADGLVGVGADRPYDFGVGLGLRLKF